MRHPRAIWVWSLGLALLGPGLADEPAPARPVVAAAGLAPARVPAGGTLTLVVRARMAPGWHVYAANRPAAGSFPTTLTLRLPEGVRPRGDWTYPVPVPDPAGQGWVYEGDVTFRRTLTVAPGIAPGPIRVTCELGYQACDAASCRPPAKMALQARAEVAPPR